MEYQGYVGRVEFDDEAGIFHGEVLNLRDVITFQGTTVAELRRAFRESVDDYLAFCAARGEPPEKPCTGHFVTRVSPDLHRQISLAARRAGQSLNAWVTAQLTAAADRPQSVSRPERRPPSRQPRRTPAVAAPRRGKRRSTSSPDSPSRGTR